MSDFDAQDSLEIKLSVNSVTWDNKESAHLSRNQQCESREGKRVAWISSLQSISRMNKVIRRKDRLRASFDHVLSSMSDEQHYQW